MFWGSEFQQQSRESSQLGKNMQPWHKHNETWHCYAVSSYDRQWKRDWTLLKLRPATRAAQRGLAPPGKMYWTSFEITGHSSKSSDLSRKTLRPSWCPKLVVDLMKLDIIWHTINMHHVLPPHKVRHQQMTYVATTTRPWQVNVMNHLP